MKPRKNLPKTALPRIYFIDQEIAMGKYPNAPALAKKYETSLSSINRDIAYMRDMMGAPIEYDFFKKGFFYSEKTFRLPAVYATADDLLAFGMAKNILDIYRNTPIYESALNLLESISAPLKDEQGNNWFKNRIVIPKTASAPVDNEAWNNIVKSLKENKVITFEYRDATAKNWRTHKKAPGSKLDRRRCRPYQLLFDLSAWYLFAYDESRNDMRLYAMSRISNVVVTPDSFKIEKGFDYRSLEGISYFGIYKGSETFKFEIEITGDIRWIKERQWAEDQRIEEISPEGKSGIILSFTSNQFERVLEWILSLGYNARPLAPAKLVDRWGEIIRKMAKLIECDDIVIT